MLDSVYNRSEEVAVISSSFDTKPGQLNIQNFTSDINEWQRLAREQKPLSLILCDVDYFKAYNDTYGHLEGDGCLPEIAKILRGFTRRPTHFSRITEIKSLIISIDFEQ